MQDLSRMSNQERIAALGVEEADKYRGPYKRRGEGVLLIPALTREGAIWHQQQDQLENLAEKMGVKRPPRRHCPKSCIVPTQSFRRGKNVEQQPESE